MGEVTLLRLRGSQGAVAQVEEVEDARVACEEKSLGRQGGEKRGRVGDGLGGRDCYLGNDLGGSGGEVLNERVGAGRVESCSR